MLNMALFNHFVILEKVLSSDEHAHIVTETVGLGYPDPTQQKLWLRIRESWAEL